MKNIPVTSEKIFNKMYYVMDLSYYSELMLTIRSVMSVDEFNTYLQNNFGAHARREGWRRIYLFESRRSAESAVEWINSLIMIDKFTSQNPKENDTIDIDFRENNMCNIGELLKAKNIKLN